jgi:hypothetical protein
MCLAPQPSSRQGRAPLQLNGYGLGSAGSPLIFADFPEQFCNSTVKAVLNLE